MLVLIGIYYHIIPGAQIFPTSTNRTHYSFYHHPGR